MEYTGRIKKVLPLKSGISQKTGNEWKKLPFIFEYFEHETDRFADSVKLETFDTNVIEHLKEGMEVRCGWGNRTREYNGEFYNEQHLYKIESVKDSKPAGDAAGVVANQPSGGANQPAGDAAGVADKEGGDEDDLPF